MKTYLICPAPRPNVRLLSQELPLVLVPMLGQSLVEYWLTHLACSGVKQVRLLVDDRPDLVQALVADGSRWGVRLEVVAESRELTRAEALIKYQQDLPANNPPQNAIVVLDHFPELPQFPLFDSYQGWVAGLRAWMPQARMPDRIGVRELLPGVWAGLHARVDQTAKITAPCWVGKNAFVGPRAVIGPHAVIEDGSFIESGAEVVESCIGPDTLVGQCAHINESIALGSTLLNWKTGSVVTVPDPFMLCALRRPRAKAREGWLQRLAELWSHDHEEEHEAFLKDCLIKKESGT